VDLEYCNFADKRLSHNSSRFDSSITKKGKRLRSSKKEKTFLLLFFESTSFTPAEINRRCLKEILHSSRFRYSLIDKSILRLSLAKNVNSPFIIGYVSIAGKFFFFFGGPKKKKGGGGDPPLFFSFFFGPYKYSSIKYAKPFFNLNCC